MNCGRYNMETRKEQKERRRQEIIYAALELFVSKGYAATKVTDIAKRLIMSTGLLFHYFAGFEGGKSGVLDIVGDDGRFAIGCAQVACGSDD